MRLKVISFLFFYSILSGCKEGYDEPIFETQGESKETFDRKSSTYISGNIRNAKGMELTLEAPLLKSKGKSVELGSTVVDDKGNFELRSSLPGLGYYMLKTNGSIVDSVELTLAPNDSIHIEAHKDSLHHTIVASGVLWAPILQEYQKIRARKNSKELSDFAAATMKANPGSPFNIVLSLHIMKWKEHWNEERIQIFGGVAAAFFQSDPESEVTQNFVKQFESMQTYMLNNGFYEAPDFVSTMVNEKKIALSDLRGKYVLIDFWASWCGPCRRENPNVVKIYKKYQAKNFTILSVSLDQELTKWKAAIQQDKLDWPYHVSDLKGWNSAVVPLYSIKGIPFTVLVNPKGRIIGINLRGEALEDRLKKIFKF